MNIVVLSSSFPRHEGDAAGRFVLDLSRGLAELGHNLIHVVPEGQKPHHLELPENLQVETFHIGFRNWGRSLVYGDGIGANIKAKPHLAMAVPSLIKGFEKTARRILENLESPVLLSHWAIPAGLAAAKLAQELKFRHVAVEHGGGIQTLMRMPLGGKKLRAWASGTDAALFVSQDLKNKASLALGADMIDQTLVMPMPIDPGRFESREPESWRNTLGIEANATVLLGVGRLIALKGFDLLLRAAAQMPGTTVLIAGAGPELRALEDLAKSLDVSCHFLGQMSPQQLGDLYRESDVLVVPSRLGAKGRSEGSPMVAMEAMAQGLPVVASRTGGLPDLVAQSGAGRLFEADNVEELIESLSIVTHDAALRVSMKNKGLQFGAGHTYSVAAQRLEALFRCEER